MSSGADPPSASGDALGQLLAEHQTWLAMERGVSANTLAAYRRDLTAYGAFLRARGVTDPTGVGEEVVAAFVEDLKAATDDEGRTRYKASSVARTLVAVRSFHGFCAEEGHTLVDPSADVTAPRVPQGLPKALTEAEVEALLDAVVGEDPAALRDRAMLETLYATGLRISELVGLDVGDLDLEDGFLRAFGKGAKERVVPVGRAARAALTAWLPARAALVRPGVRRRGDPDAVFVNPAGRRLTRQGAWKIVRAHGLRAGLGERLSPHVLRHSCATHMVEHGADLRVVQELLGHASVSTTQVYTKVTQARLRAVYAAAHPRAHLSGAHGASVAGGA
ncbi:MAG: tyrosine recombinase XerD [Actinomycetota bacterium]|nr:tyrosine recombinase XerD [Actinomycetota bacterium]